MKMLHICPLALWFSISTKTYEMKKIMSVYDI